MADMNTNPTAWSDDYLGRKEDADYLTNYLQSRYQAKKHESGFVVAVNGDWGSGKTFMMERWASDISQSGHPTVMFNSWENDFTSEPLVAFIAEIDRSLTPYFEKIPAAKRLQKEWLGRAKAVLIPTLKVAGLTALKIGVGIGTSQLSELFSERNDDIEKSDASCAEKNGDKDVLDKDAIQEKLLAAIDEKLSEHNNTKDAIGAFKEKFSAIIEQLENESNIQLPIIIFIDELDRCRPDYAIKLLEGIKHLFGIPGLYFVVSTNLDEMAQSVKAVYGAGFSSERYLKRFFDMEYSLPEASGAQFCTELMAPLAAIKTPAFITGLEHIVSPAEMQLKGLPYIFYRYSQAFELTLRDQQQAARILETSIISLRNSSIHIHFLIFLSIVYQKSSQVYKNIANSLSLTAQTRFQTIYPQNGKGNFNYNTWNGYETVNYNTSCADVAGRYFDFLNSNNLSIHETNSTDFPKNLQRHLQVNDIEVTVIKNYIEVVRRAGHFST